MSSHDITLSSSGHDRNSPASAVIFTNASPLPVTFAVSVELSRAGTQAPARAVFRGLHITMPNREHTLELHGQATVLRTVLVLYAPAMQQGEPRPVTLELTSEDTLCSVRVLGFAPYDT